MKYPFTCALLFIRCFEKFAARQPQVASLGVVVEAKDDHAEQFYKQFGFIASSETRNQLLLRMEAIEKLLSEV